MCTHLIRFYYFKFNYKFINLCILVNIPIYLSVNIINFKVIYTYKSG